MEQILPNQARMYQIQQYHAAISQALEQTSDQPLKTLYELLLTELEITLQQFTQMQQQEEAAESATYPPGAT